MGLFPSGIRYFRLIYVMVPVLCCYYGCLALLDLYFVEKTSANSYNDPKSKSVRKVPMLKSPYWQETTMFDGDIIDLVLSSLQVGQTENRRHSHLVAYFLQANRLGYHVFSNNSFPDTYRKKKMEWLYIEALKYFMSSSETSSLWPHLSLELNNKTNGSIAFLMDYGDLGHWQESIFKVRKNGTIGGRVAAFSNSMSADPHAHLRMAFPTYFSIELARSESRRLLNHSISKQSWERKHSQAVWRGTCNNGEERWNLNKLAFQSASKVLDVRFTGVSKAQLGRRNFTQVGALESRIPMERFSDYKAILDVDGNSWSGRFGSLLCLDSVVVKIEPRMVDYFWSEVQPWQHYVPVHANLSNLLEQVEWVLAHAKESQEIIRNANDWCRDKFQTDVLARDLLNIWESYASRIRIPSTENEPNKMDAIQENLVWVELHSQ